MDEKQQLITAQEQLKQSISNAFQDLRTYGKAVANHTGAIYASKKDDLLSRIELAKLEREMERDIKARTREHKSGMKAAFREQEKLERKARRLQFKQGIKQKTSSVFGKLGQVKNDILVKLSPTNIDVKLRNFYEQAQIAGLTAASKGKETYETVAKKVDDFTTEQIAKYYEYQERRKEAKAEADFQEQVRAEEIAKEEARKAETKERKAAMKEAIHEYEKQQRAARRLQFKQGIKQKTSSVFGKLGQVKNDILVKLSPTNIDVKLRNFYEQAQIAGLTAAAKGKETYETVAKKVDDFTTKQIAKYYERKETKAEAKAFKEAARQAEKEEIERIKARTKEHKAAMKEALNAQEREMYETKHLENQARKQELMSSLFGTNDNYEQEVSYARAM